MKAAITLMLCATLLLAGCTVPWLTTRKLQAEDRIVTGVEREVSNGGNTEKMRIICPEPSPDALKAIAASGSLGTATAIPIERSENTSPPSSPQTGGKKEEQSTPPRHTTQPERPKWQTHTPFNDI